MSGLSSIKIHYVKDQEINEKATESKLLEIRSVPLGDVFVMHLALSNSERMKEKTIEDEPLCGHRFQRE